MNWGILIAAIAVPALTYLLFRVRSVRAYKSLHHFSPKWQQALATRRSTFDEWSRQS